MPARAPPSAVRWAGRIARAASDWAVLPGPARAVARPLAEGLRRMLVRLGDPCIDATIAGTTIELPLSHDLPRHRALHPLYDTALGRVARVVWEARPGSSVIDIGANVGDTAAIIRGASPAPILCIEGSDAFFPVLERNARRIGGVHVAKSFVGADRGVMHGTIEVERGTAWLKPQGPDLGAEIRLERLEDIVSRWPDLPPPGLVKIDTDGFDCPIVEAAGDCWARSRPVLFFEYDPDFYPPDWSPLGMFARLREIGYERALFYENVGDLVASIPLEEEGLLEDLHALYSGWGHARYADVCLFHGTDRDAGERFRRSEVSFARAHRRDRRW